jgi:DNA-binding LacI/PurR family transcriptional regulator
MLSAENRPDSVLCNDNMVALGVIQAAKKLSISIPDELGIVTFDNYPIAEYVDPSLTVVDIDTALLGEQTANLLFQCIERISTNQQTLLGTSLIERESSSRKK